MNKKLVFGLFLLTSFASHAGIYLNCRYDADDIGRNDQIVVRQVLNMECKSYDSTYDPNSPAMVNVKPKATYKVTMRGWGPGVFFSTVGVPQIVCPSVRKKALGVDSFTNKRGEEVEGTKTFIGVNAQAGFFLGAQASAFANEKGGVCLLAGINMSVGAGASGVQLKFSKR